MNDFRKFCESKESARSSGWIGKDWLQNTLYDRITGNDNFKTIATKILKLPEDNNIGIMRKSWNIVLSPKTFSKYDDWKIFENNSLMEKVFNLCLTEAGVTEFKIKMEFVDMEESFNNDHSIEYKYTITLKEPVEI